MKTKIIIISLLAVLLGSITSCDGFLDTMPDKRAEVNSLQKVKDLLVSAYPKSSALLMEEMMSDNRQDNGDKYSLPNNTMIQSFRWEDITDVDQDTPGYMWDGCYMIIAAANQALVAIRELGEPEEALPYKGEALICRAYGHFLLTNVFCMAYGNDADKDLGVPYMTAPGTSIGVKYERGTLKETYEKINKDIEEALPLISDEAYTVPLYHFNKRAAYSFAAQFNLFYNQYEKAIRYATEAIGEDPGSLLRNMNGYSQFPSSKEYTLAFIDKDEPANLMLIGALSRWGTQYTNQRYGHNRTLCEGETIWSPAAWGHLMAYDKVLGYGDQSIFVPKMDAIFETTNAVLNTGYYRQVIFAFTSDKTLLNRAEAYILAKQYDKGVRDLQYWCKAKVAAQIPDMESLNTFYEKTVDPKTNGKPLNPKFDIESGLQTNLLKAVIHARRIETVHEGERWLDVKRFGLEITRELFGESPIVLEAHDLRKAIQIPAAVISAGMERNPR